jgi:hypothetical protein
VTKDERLWTRAEVAEYLGVNPKSVARLGVPRVALGRLNGSRPTIRYDPAEVRAWVELSKSRSLLRSSSPARR